MPADPWQSFAEFYDYVPLYRERKDVAFYVEEAKRATGLVLELGCGSGRVLVPVARAGVPVTGLDASPDMLRVCRSRLRQEGLAAELICGDMRRFALHQNFALVTIPFRPFQHLLEVEDQMACLSSIREHLAPGGALVFDVFNPDLKMLNSEDTAPVQEFSFELPDGRQVTRSIRRLRHDRARQIQHLEVVHDVRHSDGSTRQTTEALPMRYFFRYELEHLLSRCGFSVEHLYGDFDRRPVGEDGSAELIFVARLSLNP